MENVVNEQQKVVRVKKVHTVRVDGLNKPWLLLMIPLLAGAVWLAGNTWVITDNINKPYALLAGPAFVGSILVLWLTIKFFQSIMRGGKAAWQAFQRARKEDGSAQFFWIVIVVFMIVSVFASGSFFSVIEHDALPLLGYATALFIDLVAVQAMRARLNAVRMRNAPLARLYLFGVLVCAGASAFANVYTSLSTFHQHATGALPVWMVTVAPWFGLVFPALILLLSVTADYTIDQVNTRLNPEQYREQQAKQTKLLEYQRDALKERLAFEQEIDTLTNKLQGKNDARVFFLVNWLFPRKGVASAQVEEIAKQVQTLGEKSDYLYQQLTQVVTQNQQLYTIFCTHVGQHDVDFGLISQELQVTKNQLDMVSSMLPYPNTRDNTDPNTDPDMEMLSVDNRFLDGIADDGFNTEEQENVNDPLTPRRRITVKLSDTSVSSERNTDKLNKVHKTSSASDDDVVKHVRRLLRKNPNLTAINIGKQVGISRQRAGKIKAQIVNGISA